jgi:hypothetical protein
VRVPCRKHLRGRRVPFRVVQTRRDPCGWVPAELQVVLLPTEWIDRRGRWSLGHWQGVKDRSGGGVDPISCPTQSARIDRDLNADSRTATALTSRRADAETTRVRAIGTLHSAGVRLQRGVRVVHPCL